jgi:hypothetical protein
LEQGGGQEGGVASHHNRLVPQALPDLGAPPPPNLPPVPTAALPGGRNQPGG